MISCVQLELGVPLGTAAKPPFSMAKTPASGAHRVGYAITAIKCRLAESVAPMHHSAGGCAFVVDLGQSTEWMALRFYFDASDFTMTDTFGPYADAIQGAAMTFLKSECSSRPWGVEQRPVGRTVLQFGMDGGAAVSHGVTDPASTSLLMQVTGYDDRVLLDGMSCPSCVLIVLPPECHFTVTRSGPVRWFSWSIPKDESIALKIGPPETTENLLKTEKLLIALQQKEASALRSATYRAICYPASDSIEQTLFYELEHAWKKRLSTTSLPSDSTRSAEQIVFRALRFVQSRPDESIRIKDLAEAGGVGYRTLLRAFDRYLKLTPKHYLKLRQINNVYHAIRRGDGAETLTDILYAHGVTEFGRFAGEYSSIFGELPSATLQRFRRGTVEYMQHSALESDRHWLWNDALGNVL